MRRKYCMNSFCFIRLIFEQTHHVISNLAIQLIVTTVYEKGKIR